MVIYTKPTTPESIPVIDLKESFSSAQNNRLRVARQIDEACRDVGFLYVTNHGIPASLIQAQFGIAQQFFARPDQEKQQYSAGLVSSKLGFEPMAQQRLDADSPPDLKESFIYSIDRSPDHPWVKTGQTHYGRNSWPTNPATFQDTALKYYAAVFGLGLHLMRLMALALDLPESYFDNQFSDSNAIVRLLHYPPHPSGAQFNQLGAGAHTDWGALTILAQDNVGGLEVQLTNGEWIRAIPVEGAFVVNIGDLLARWSNDRYRSTMHRVLNNASGRDRYSIPMFVSPDLGTIVECIPACLHAGESPRYDACTAGEYFTQMYLRSRGLAASQARV
jgi:isopenicillin N synthase-like dioxygenase